MIRKYILNRLPHISFYLVYVYITFFKPVYSEIFFYQVIKCILIHVSLWVFELLYSSTALIFLLYFLSILKSTEKTCRWNT